MKRVGRQTSIVIACTIAFLCAIAATALGVERDIDEMIELESVAPAGNFTVVQDPAASGGAYIVDSSRRGSKLTDPDSKEPEVAIAFIAPSDAKYYIWLRYSSADSSTDSFYLAMDNEKLYSQYGIGVKVTGDKEWGWQMVKAYNLKAGGHTLKMSHREAGMKMDAVYITANSAFNPSAAALYPTPPVLPPPGHPRVYFRAEDIPRILANAAKPQNAQAWAKHESNLASTAIDTIPPLRSGATTNYSSAVLGVIESRAFDYALRGNVEAGKRAIAAMRQYVENVVYAPDDYNNTGQTIFTIAVVYDWCYPLLTQADKEFFAAAVINTASKMEIGWPPTKQGAVTGHGSEAQLMRDLLSAAIAMYDERPDIYMIVAGRFFHEYIEPRKFMYSAHMHSQGDHYTAYRAQWEILATLIMDAIGVPQVFGPDQQHLLYWTLYARRPDGQVLRDGDTSANNATVGQYNTRFYRSMIHIGNYFNDPYVKGEGLRELAQRSFNPSGNQTLSCVEYLIFNNPDLAGKPTSELPLTKYFPSPKGAMIARTSWEEGLQSPAVVAEMKINEYNFANHQHLDAGSFQIYYKGALATDSGYYQAGLNIVGSADGNNGSSGYGSLHDFNYNKRSIAHNTMLVFDPNEDMAGRANDGGQRIPNRGREARTLAELLDPANGYKTGEILGHEFGPDTMAPDYSYLKGDLTAAYSDKIRDYERSFMFLNLKSADHPAALVVFDRVVAKDANFKKTWLLHGLQEPEINGTQTVFKNTRPGYNGQLTVDTLLPKADNVAIQAIGGPGKEFWVNGVNYHAITTSNGNNEGGGWRVEISPKQAQELDYFLHVLQVGDAVPAASPLPVTAIETDRVAGVQIADRVVIFGKAKAKTKEPVEFAFAGDGVFQITVADMAAGTWRVTRDGVELCRTNATAEGGVVAFMGGAGSYRLDYVSDVVADLTTSLEIASPRGGDLSGRVPVVIELDTWDQDPQSIVVSLDDTVIWRGTTLPTDLAITTWELEDGKHQLTVEFTDSRGFVYKRQAQFSVTNTRIHAPAARAVVHGVMPISVEVRVPAAELRDVAVVLQDADGVTVREMHSTSTPQVDFVLDTLELADGTYTLTATTTTAAGNRSTDVRSITVHNWRVLVDNLEPPMEVGWFGGVKRLKTVSESAGWRFLTDRPDDFLGDANRLVHDEPATAPYLVWETPKLVQGEVTLYAQRDDVSANIELAVSTDQEAWLSVPYRVKAVATSPAGWRKLSLVTEISQGVAVNFIRLTLTGTDASADNIQLGTVTWQCLAW